MTVNFSALMKRFLCVFLAVATFNLSSISAQAEMLSTSQAVSQLSASAERAKLLELLNKQEVQDQLVKWGVSAEEAKARVASLSDDEVLKASQHMDQLPAGADGVGTVVGAALIIFLVLLVTDILGLTNVFPFVRK